MSLQVWLPFTDGTLKQQGLSDAEATIGTIITHTWESTGKVGNGSSKGHVIVNGSNLINIFNSTHFSICFWCNISETTASSSIAETYVISCGASGTRTNLHIPIRVNGGAMAFCFYSDDYTFLNSVSDRVGTWMHVACIYNNRQQIVYINGEKIGERTTSGDLNITSGSPLHLYSAHTLLNDFRIYDHALSPMEVKRISQGLVLHYPLNREGWGQENLMPNSTIMSVGSANASTGSWRVAGSSQMTRSRVAISDSPIGDVYGCQSVGLQTGQDASCWGIDSFPRENGTTYTISAWGRIVGGSSTAAMLGFSIYSGTTLDYGGTYGQAKSSDTKYYGSGAYDYAGGQLNPNGNWTRIYRTFTSTSTSDNIYVGFNTAKTGNSVTLQLCGVKLEKEDKVTSWCPKSTDDLADVIGLNENIEYDCSGYNNNGEKIGNLTYTSNTSKYSVSTHITNGANTRISTPTLTFPNNSLTLNIWFRSTNTSPTGNYHMVVDSVANRQWYEMCINNTGFLRAGLYINGTRYADNCTSKTALDGNWHMLTMTYDGTVIKRYFDGVMEKSTSITATTGLSSPTALMLGRDGPNASYACIDADLSDFRIYVTALSEEDVRALYEDSAYIASDGTSYAYEFVEE